MPNEIAALPSTITAEVLKQLELLRIRARKSFLGSRQGGHLSLKRGHGIEFSDYRKYELGDNPRHIDWGVYGRTDRLYVKRFQEEQDLNVVLLLDASASMFFPEEDRKWKRAADLALALSYLALMQQESLYVCPLGGKQASGLFGARAFQAALRLLVAIKQPAQGDFASEMQRAAARVRFPGVAVVISDFLMPLEDIQRGFLGLMAKNFDITAIQVLGSNDLQPFPSTPELLAVDSETGEELPVALDQESRQLYEARFKRHEELLRRFFAHSRIHYAVSFPQEDLCQFIQTSLTRTGLVE